MVEVSKIDKELAEYFATDEGRTVFEAAMKSYEGKREEERSARMVKGMIDAFSQKANLSREQTASMEKIVSKAFTEIGTLFRTMRDSDMTPEERAVKRTETVAKVEDVRRQTEDEVKGILDATQFELYQQESARMRGFMGGGMGGGLGGFGGQRGQ